MDFWEKKEVQSDLSKTISRQEFQYDGKNYLCISEDSWLFKVGWLWPNQLVEIVPDIFKLQECA